MTTGSGVRQHCKHGVQMVYTLYAIEFLTTTTTVLDDILFVSNLLQFVSNNGQTVFLQRKK